MEVKYGLVNLIILMCVCHALSISELELLSGYDRWISSNTHRNVNIHLMFRSLIDFDPYSALSLYGEFRFEWVDDQLTWNDSDIKHNTPDISTGNFNTTDVRIGKHDAMDKLIGNFNTTDIKFNSTNINTTNSRYNTNGMLINIHKIWSPSIDLLNSMKGLRIDGQSEDRRNEHAYVSMDGHVTWKARAVLDPVCSGNYDWNPLNAYYCKFSIAHVTSYSYVANNFDFQLTSIYGYTENRRWIQCGTTSKVKYDHDDFYNPSLVVYEIWLNNRSLSVGHFDFITRILLIALISGCSICVFKMPPDPVGRIALISTVLLVTNLFDSSTLETPLMKTCYNVLLCANVLICFLLIIIVLGIKKISPINDNQEPDPPEQGSREEDNNQEPNPSEHGSREEESLYDRRNYILFKRIYVTVFCVVYFSYCIVLFAKDSLCSYKGNRSALLPIPTLLISVSIFGFFEMVILKIGITSNTDSVHQTCICNIGIAFLFFVVIILSITLLAITSDSEYYNQQR